MKTRDTRISALFHTGCTALQAVRRKINERARTFLDSWNLRVCEPPIYGEELERRISFDASFGDLLFHDALPNLADIPHVSSSDHHVVLITDSVAATDGVRQAIPKDSQVIVVDSYQDNLKTINEKITQQVQADGRKIGSLAVLAHAEKGKVILGRDKIDLANVQEFKPQLEQLGKNFADKGQIQLFGCSVAEDVYGQGLVEVISVSTHTHVFASTNATGHGPDKDWNLEYSTNPQTQMKTALDAEQLAALPLDLAPGYLVVTKGTVGPLTSVTVDTIINLNNAFSVTHSSSANSATLTNVTLLANPSEGVAQAWTSISVNTDTDFLTGLGLGAGNVDVTVTGQIRIISVTADQATAILGTLSGTLAADFTGNAQILIYAQDTNWDGADSTLDVLVSKPPQITVPGAQSLPANSTATVSPSVDVIGPPDTATLRMTLSATQGTLTLSQTTDLDFLTGDGTNDATMVFTGTIAKINAALNGMTYTPNANYAGTDTLSITANDQSSPTPGSGTGTVAITVTNTAPTIALPEAQTTTFNTPLTIAPNITVTDAESGTAPLRVTMSVTHGTLTLATTGGLTFLTGTGTADTAMQFAGNLANINTALKSLTYTPSTDYGGTDSLSITVNDQVTPTPASSTQIVAITVYSGTGPEIIFTTPVPVDLNSTTLIPDLSVNDVGIGTGKITVTMSVEHGTLSAQIREVTTTTTDTVPPRTITEYKIVETKGARISFTDELQWVRTSLSGIMYTPTTSFTGTDNLTITAVDPSTPPAHEHVVINVSAPIPVVSPPVIHGPLHWVAQVDPNVTSPIADVSIESSNTTTLTVTLSANHGMLTVQVPATTPGTTPTTYTNANVTFTDTVTNVNTALAGLKYTPTTGYAGATDTISINAVDQSLPPQGGNTTATIGITVNPSTAAAPVLTVPGAQTVSENLSLAIAGISVTDADIGDTGKLTVTLTVSHGTVTVQVPATTPGTSPVTQTGSIIAFTDTLANVNTALAGLKYTPTAKYDSTDTLTITVVDQSPSPLSDNGTVDITVTNVAPTISPHAAITATAGRPLSISGITVTDPDIAQRIWRSR